MDDTGCHPLDVFLTRSNNVVKSANPTRCLTLLLPRSRGGATAPSTAAAACAACARASTKAGLSLHSRGCQVGYTDHTGYLSTIDVLTIRPTRGLSLPAVINWCFDARQ
jgi:hypothetical protein